MQLITDIQKHTSTLTRVKSDATPVNHSATTPELHRLPPNQHLQSAVESLLAIALAIDKVSA